MGGTLGVTLASASYEITLNQKLLDRFGAELGAADEIYRILHGLRELKNLAGGWRAGVMASFTEAFRVVWIMMACWATLALISVSLVKQHKLHDRLDRL